MAQGLLFPITEWGKARMALPQSAGSLESLFQVSDENFEPIVAFSNQSPFRIIAPSIGRLEIKARDQFGRLGVEVCTASLLSKDLALTNNHCIPGTGDFSLLEAQLRMGYLSERELPGNTYSVSLIPVESDATLDYSIIKVYGNPSNKYGLIPLGPKTISPSEDLFIIHHPLGKPLQLTRKDCRAVSWETDNLNNINHRCDTLDGSSGAPIFSLITRKVVGIHFQGGMGATQDSYNSGKRLDKIIERSSTLQNLLRQQSQPVAVWDKKSRLCDFQDDNVRSNCLAASKGDQTAQLQMGLAFDEGAGVIKDYEKAAKWFKQAANQGNSDAQTMLGYYYEKGYGVTLDREKFIHWTEKAAKAGNCVAQQNMGEAYELGTGVPVDLDLAAYWYRQSMKNAFCKDRAEQRLNHIHGTPEQFNKLGDDYFEQGAESYDDAVYWYEKAAREGHTIAMVHLGYMFHTGKGKKNDYAEAAYWFREAADANNMVSQYNLGLYYEMGYGVRQDLQKARHWYEKSAQQGYENATKALQSLGK